MEVQLDNRTTLLFDWGDTLMEDTLGVPGKMCEWPQVKAMPGAEKMLQTLSQSFQICIATGAEQSTEADIRRAFRRVDLDQYIDHYFCRQNTGLSKPDPAFYQFILNELGLAASDVVMIGDHWDKDILPAAGLGMAAVWINVQGQAVDRTELAGERDRLMINVKQCQSLNELAQLLAI
ncbi:HAD family hydrolase [Corallincola spongiicola]|uniref:HAD family hydrolase n=1 Tax=Corallincola spongiicola TaxID=2520508 RepID=A0ABY1WUT8_9GAMM|nr:HAD-IA family hydrolase [Corallincola spongiicola]TAA48509.1 HAD family hydrolase [Corallincola spongiicola]